MEHPLNHFFTHDQAEAIRHGPLKAEIESYAQRLGDQGYALQTGRVQLRMLGHFNRWLERNKVSAQEIDASTLERFVAFRQRRFKRRRDDRIALCRLLNIVHPQQQRIMPDPTAQQIVLQQFRLYLEQERGLSAATVVNYTPIIRAFLSDRFQTGDIDLQAVSASDITGFVQRQAERIHSKRAPLVVSALRSFLRHLLYRGAIHTDLGACVPTIATWSLSKIPKFLPADQIQKVLDSCDRSTALGKRNYAILLLLARLGLRAGEVVVLTLDDIDWEAGVITVRGKGKRVAQLPMPTDVGAAIVEYLREGRPRSTTRRLFIRQKAPLVGLANSIAICSLVDRALEKAGVESSYRGSHLFRHSLATQMVNNGATLPEIGELLRHRRPDTTAIYAKVDLVSLRTIAISWPGGGY
jgi:site-specific recombinase XerD